MCGFPAWIMCSCPTPADCIWVSVNSCSIILVAPVRSQTLLASTATDAGLVAALMTGLLLNAMFLPLKVLRLAPSCAGARAVRDAIPAGTTSKCVFGPSNRERNRKASQYCVVQPP